MTNAELLYQDVVSAQNRPAAKQAVTALIDASLQAAYRRGWEEGMSEGVEQGRAETLEEVEDAGA